MPQLEIALLVATIISTALSFRMLWAITTAAQHMFEQLKAMYVKEAPTPLKSSPVGESYDDSN